MLTEAQKLYAKARLKGLNQTQSAIAAGYSEATARQAASRLEKNPLVIAHMDRLVKFGDAPEAVKPKAKAAPKAEKPKPAETKQSDKPEKPEPPAQTENAAIAPVHSSDPTVGILDPLEYMEQLVSDMSEDPKLRLEAAKALAPYRHAKLGEMGKKDAKNNDASNAAKGKYASAGVPPGLQRVK
jgi:phage terminase small subunit